MNIIYHITTHKEWNEAMKTGQLVAASLALEGFILCSTKEQVDGVVNR